MWFYFFIVTLLEARGRTFCNNGMELNGGKRRKIDGHCLKEDCLLNVVLISVRPSLKLADL